MKRLTLAKLYEAYMFEQTITTKDLMLNCIEAPGTNHCYVVSVTFADKCTMHEYVSTPYDFKDIVKRINNKLERLQKGE